MKLNSKGFTLVEVLAVLIILSAIIGLAIPSFISSLEVNEKKQEENRKERILSGAEIYVTNHKKEIYESGDDPYIIEIDSLIKEGYVDSDDDGTGHIEFSKTANTYTWVK